MKPLSILWYHTLNAIASLTTAQVANPSVAALYEDALVYETGSAITSTGALTAYSGTKTGRSPLDKRIVKEEGSDKDVWWGPVNKPMSPDVSDSPSSASSVGKRCSFPRKEAEFECCTAGIVIKRSGVVEPLHRGSFVPSLPLPRIFGNFVNVTCDLPG
jgi:hypothetical protein